MVLTVILRPKRKLIKSQEASRNHLTKISRHSELKPSYRCIGSDENQASDAHKIKLGMLRQKTLTKITMLKNRKLRGTRNVRRRFPQIQLPTRIHERKRKLARLIGHASMLTELNTDRYNPNKVSKRKTLVVRTWIL